MKRKRTLIGAMIICILIMAIFKLSFYSLFTLGLIWGVIGLNYITRASKEIDNRFLKVIAKLYMVGFVVFIVSFVALMVLMISNMTYTYESEPVRYAIILGAGLDGAEVSPRLKDRLDKSVEYASQNEEVVFIVSGGQGADELISEAEAMKNYLIYSGISEGRIIMEDQSTSTAENLIYSKAILEELGALDEQIMIITSDYHIFRAEMIADGLGIDSVGLSNASPLTTRMKYMIREYFAFIKDYLKIKIM